MGEPKGKIVVPLGINPDGDLRSLELTAADALKVAFAAAAQGLVGPHGWIGGAWQKNPFQRGYSSTFDEEKSNLAAVAGTNILAFSTVPAGEIWEVQIMIGVDVNSPTTFIEFAVAAGGLYFPVQVDAAVGASVFVNWEGFVTLKPGDYAQVVFRGCTVGDDLYARVHAVTMDIDQ